MKSTSVVYASRRGRVTSVYVPWATLVSGSPAAFIPSIRSERVAVMAYSNSPPGRRSSLWTVVVNPSGPTRIRGPPSSSRVPRLPSRTPRRSAPTESSVSKGSRRSGSSPSSACPSLPLRVGLREDLDIDFRHLQQGFHDFRRVSGFWIAHHLPQDGGDDLPRYPELVLEPPAGLLLPAFGEPLPQPVDLFLRVAAHEEGSPLREREVRAAVHGHESRSVEFERRVQHLAFHDRTSRLPADHADDPGILEDRDVALHGLLGLIAERQKRGDLLRGVLLPALPCLPVVRHGCVSLRFPARTFCRRLSSAPNLSRRASHRPRYCRIHLSSSRNGSAHNE